MENLEFVPMAQEHCNGIMDIFNYYAENSFSAYPEQKLPYEFFGRFLEMTKGYPAFTALVSGQVAGFCFIRAYNPFPAFKETAEISYFIHKDFSGKGIGKSALELLESSAKKDGIKTILASITSENIQSLNFHKKFGFVECGRFHGVAQKFGKTFDIIWMEKKI